MAGNPRAPRAWRTTFCDNLRYAAARAAPRGITILIEPLNAL